MKDYDLPKETEARISAGGRSPQFTPGRVDELVNLLRKSYPGWENFSHQRFVEEEIEYKRAASDQARRTLGKEELQQLLEAGEYGEFLGRVKKVAQSTNLLYVQVPSAGDVNIVFQSSLDERGFCENFFSLLHGDGESEKRLEKYLDWVDRQRLPSKWTFPTYYLFLLHPETEIFVKPSLMKHFLAKIGLHHLLQGKPSAKQYMDCRQIARELAHALEPYGAQDMIDVQSFVYVVAKPSAKLWMTAERRKEFETFFEEFAHSYPDTRAGLEHRRLYGESRKEAKKNLAEIRRAKKQGQDVTDKVLLKLLPYADLANNRASGAWISPAPAIIGNLKGWFEAKGYRKRQEWPAVASSILSFVEACIEDPTRLTAECSAFAKDPLTKGVQTGMLTPILNALRPDSFLLINQKSRLVVNFFAGSNFGSSLEDYPQANQTGFRLIEELADVLDRPLVEGLARCDLFDMFCHWLVAVKKQSLRREKYWKVAPGENAWQWEECLQGGFIAIGWDELGDVSGLSRAEFDERRDRLVAERQDWTKRGANQVWKFAHIEEGDRIIANRGTQEVVGIGTVTGPYYFVPGTRHGHRLPVEWNDTQVRKVDETGWKRTLVKLSTEKFRKISGPSPPPLAKAVFTKRTFDLLGGLQATPTRDYYSKHKEEIRKHVERPLQILLDEVARRLPERVRAVMETEKGLFSRIPKNDWGRGGAWSFYWGAFYPKGGKRIADAQLFTWMNRDGLDFGFYIGEYGTEARDRFIKNWRQNRGFLIEALAGPLSEPSLSFGGRGGSLGGEALSEAQVKSTSWREWLTDPAAAGIRAGVSLTSAQCLARSQSELIEDVHHTFASLFPLVLLATSDDPVPDIREYLGMDERRLVRNPSYSLEQCSEETGFDLTTLRRWIRAVHRKGQAIFYGPPGTGKTYVAEKLAQHLIGGGTGFRELVQFHPAYAYEDFIQGIRPKTTAEGNLSYDLEKGLFIDFCRRARRVDDVCVLIIDEINRANLARVFGELMYLLEYRDRAVPLAEGDKLRVPGNVRIIGTMNTADRSIALVDHALRRRFAFLALRPEPDVLKRYHEREATGFDVSGLVSVLERLNSEIGDPNYAVGITFFLKKDLKDHIEDIWRMEIEPYLEEYFFDQRVKVDGFRWENVKSKILS